MLNDASVQWEIEGVMSAEESVTAMLKVIAATTLRDTGKFLRWEGTVSSFEEYDNHRPSVTSPRNMLGSWNSSFGFLSTIVGCERNEPSSTQFYTSEKVLQRYH